MSLDLSREHRIFLALWRKAARGYPVSFDCQSPSEALSTRMSMYRAIRPFRQDEFEDPELYHAAQKYAIKATGANLSIVEKHSLKTAEFAMEAFGLSEEDLLTPEEAKIKSSMAESLKELETPEPLSAENRFYSRRS